MRTGGASSAVGGAAGGSVRDGWERAVDGRVVLGAGVAGGGVVGGVSSARGTSEGVRAASSEGGSLASEAGSSGGKSRRVGDGRRRDGGLGAEPIERVVDLVTQHGGEQRGEHCDLQRDRVLQATHLIESGRAAPMAKVEFHLPANTVDLGHIVGRKDLPGERREVPALDTIAGNANDPSEELALAWSGQFDVQIEHLALMHHPQRARVVEAHRGAFRRDDRASNAGRSVGGKDHRIGLVLEALNDLGARARGTDEALVVVVPQVPQVERPGLPFVVGQSVGVVDRSAGRGESRQAAVPDAVDRVELELRRRAGALVDTAEGIGELEGAAVGNEYVGERREASTQRCGGARQPPPSRAGQQLAKDGQELEREIAPGRALSGAPAELIVGPVGVELPTFGVGATLESRQNPGADRETCVLGVAPLDRAQVFRDRLNAVGVEHRAEGRIDVGRETIRQGRDHRRVMRPCRNRGITKSSLAMALRHHVGQELAKFSTHL